MAEADVFIICIPVDQISEVDTGSLAIRAENQLQ